MRLLLSLCILVIFTSNLYSSDISCAKKSFQNLNNIEIDYLEIIPKNYRGFKLTQLKNLVSIEDDLAEKLHYSKQKRYKSLIKIFFKNKEVCILNSRIRVHGDGRDHYKFIDGDVIASIDVELLDGNLFNSIRFKLFIPESEGADSEIFNSVLFKKLNFIAPETRYLNIKIGKKKIKYLFQEHLAKEMLEKNKRKEGPILEIDEENTFGLMRIDNKKWATMNPELSSKILADINYEIIAIKNDYYLKSQKSFDVNTLIDYLYLSNYNEIYFRNLSEFVTLALATGSSHMFSANDMRYYYDAIYGVFHPIYYDAEPALEYKNLFIPKFISNYFKVETESLKKKISKINIDKFNNKLKEFGIDENKKKTIERFKIIEKNLNLINVKKKIIIDPGSYNFENLEQYFDKKNIFFVYKNENKFIVCKFIKKDCIEKKFLNTEIIDLLRQRYKQNYKVSSNPQYNFFGNIKKSKDRLIKGIYGWDKKILENNIKLYSKGASININKNKKELKIVFSNSNARSLISGNSKILKDWKINVEGREEFNGKQNLIDEDTNLTGCLTFLNLTLIDLKINSTDMHCEDSINFINTNGSINNLNILNSFSDGIDMDFSELKINNIYVNNSGNDCIDFSYGIYEINKISVYKCGDKGLSVGEKSKVKIKNFVSSYSNYGAVSKDSSKVTINNAEISYIKYCLASYNKKLEFHGSFLKVENLKCKNFYKKTFKDETSIIYLSQNEN